MSKTRSSRRSWVIRFGLFAAPFLIFVLVVELSRGGRRDVPVYQGQTADQWLRQVFSTNQTAALTAFRQMGSGATPFLVHKFEKRDWPWHRFYIWAFPKLPASLRGGLRPPVPASTIWNSANLVLLNRPVSGQEREQLLAGLLRLLESKSNPAHGYIIGPVEQLVGPDTTNALPVLIRCLQAKEHGIRQEAAAGLGNMQASAMPAVAALTNALIDSDVNMRLSAAFALWSVAQRTDLVVPVVEETLKTLPACDTLNRAIVFLNQVNPKSPELLPALIKALQAPNPGNTDDGFRLAFIVQLGNYGPAAKDAVPTLVRIAKEQSILRHLALQALEEIDPGAYDSVRTTLGE